MRTTIRIYNLYMLPTDDIHETKLIINCATEKYTIYNRNNNKLIAIHARFNTNFNNFCKTKLYQSEHNYGCHCLLFFFYYT